jgi:serine phosphatase RsbU (regulator of sigma subunit)
VRLRDALGASSNGDLAGLRRTLLERVDGHRAGAPLSDDLTLLLLRRGDPRHAQDAGLAAPRSKA